MELLTILRGVDIRWGMGRDGLLLKMGESIWWNILIKRKGEREGEGGRGKGEMEEKGGQERSHEDWMSDNSHDCMCYSAIDSILVSMSI